MKGRRPWTRIGTLLATGLLLGCSDLAPDSPLQDARRSPEALAEAALAALAERDEEALTRLMITREEYETLLWPVMPDREHMPFDFVWSVTGPRSRKARRIALSDYGGVPLELVGVELEGEVERYEGFTLHREARMTVRRTDTGDEGTLALMDVLVEMGGGWKFMNFVE
jgi:hypothetical protein